MRWRWMRSRIGLLAALAADLIGPFGHGDPTAWAVPQGVSQEAFAAALQAQEAHTEALLAQAGVVGTAVGLSPAGVPVLKVYVTEPSVRIAAASFDGVPVVREVTGRFVSWTVNEAADPKKEFARPVPIGVSSGQANVTAGTIGARGQRGDAVFALSNNHVFAASNGAAIGDNILQPGVADGGRDPDNAIGELEDYEPIKFCQAGSCPANAMDAAIARTTTDRVGNATPEGGYGTPRSETTRALLGMAVQKYGRTTGLTRGNVSGINAVIDVSYRSAVARFTGQIVISGNGFSQGGDSGSLVVGRGGAQDRKPVGLLFAGSAASTIVNPIDLVLERFDITIDGN